MNFLANLTPNQRRALMVGVPVVAVIALVQVLSGRRTEPVPVTDPETDDAAAGADAAMIAGWAMPTTDAIGTGALTDFMTQINQNNASFLAALTETLGQQESTVTPPPSTPPPSTPPPSTPPPSTPPPYTPPPSTPRPPSTPAPAPKPYSPHDDPKKGTRSSVVRSGGETIGALSARLYQSSKWWQELYWFNAADWNRYAESKGQKITAATFIIPGGMLARY